MLCKFFPTSAPLRACANILSLCFIWIFSSYTAAQEVWPGFDFEFQKAALAPPLEEQNQDRITNSTWITRGDSAGLFNAKSETAFTQSVSPAGTRWAFSGLNGNPVDPDFSAANYANLTFSPWRESLGGMGSLQTNIVNRPGVIHIVAEDIYVDILFSEWGSGGGGSFSYSRGSEPAAVPVESIPIAPVWVGACLLLFTAIAAAANRTYGA